MSITNTLFLFLFLPLALAVYHCSDDEVKEYVLLGVSLLFYALGCLEFFLRFLVVTGVVVCIGRGIAACPHRAGKRILLISGIGVNLCVLGYYKYTNFVIQTYNHLTGSAIEARTLLLPLGISFFTFKAISYLVDVYMGKAELSDSPLHDALFLTFFGHIQSGPLTRYSDLQPAADPAQKRRLFADGTFRFMIGFNKKILLANILAKITTEVFGTPVEEFSLMYAWLGAICFSMQLFFDFSGYSDMAIGISEMFGYHCMENFNFPYLTRSVSEFWRRWHISLSQWFRDYVYIPLGGSRGTTVENIRNMLVVWLLTGIWHGANFTFIFWGLAYFVLLVFEKYLLKPAERKSCILRIFWQIATLLFVNWGWVIFNSPSLKSGLRYCLSMLGVYVHQFTWDAAMQAYLREYGVYLFLGLLFSAPVMRVLEKKIGSTRVASIQNILQPILYGIVFLWAVSFLILGAHNPFIYFNF